MYGLYDYFMSCIPDRSNQVSLQKRISTSKGIGTKGIATKGIATKCIGYKRYWQQKVSATNGIDHPPCLPSLGARPPSLHSRSAACLTQPFVTFYIRN